MVFISTVIVQLSTDFSRCLVCDKPSLVIMLFSFKACYTFYLSVTPS